jgi:O-antigen ligase
MIRQSETRPADHLAAGLLALLLLAAPLPFGGVPPWAAAVLRGLAFAAFALAAILLRRPSSLRPALPPAAALLAVALLGLLQASPLPAGLAGALSPEHARLHRQAMELTGPTGESAAPRLTLAAAATRSAALGWAAAAAAFLAAAVAGRRRESRRWLAGAVLAGGLFQVFFGARDWFARSTTLWGVDLHASAVRLRGTFVNPNHLAVYLEMALPVAFAWGWWAARRAAEQTQIERRLLLLAPPVLLWLTLLAGLSFTGSRAGLLAAVAAVTVQGLLIARSRGRWWAAPLGAAAALGGLGVVAWLGLRQGGLGRLLSTSVWDVSLGSRLQEYRAALELWARFPVTGVGLGAFRDAFPMVQPPEVWGALWHPHSDLLEVLVTAGLLGAAALAVGFWFLVRRLSLVLRDGGRSEDRAAALAALGVLVSLGLHAGLDFGLTMPANALTLAVLAGGAATARTRERSVQLDAAGEDPAPVPGRELEDVNPAPQRRHRAKGGKKSGRRRADRKSGQGGAVEP